MTFYTYYNRQMPIDRVSDEFQIQDEILGDNLMASYVNN